MNEGRAGADLLINPDALWVAPAGLCLLCRSMEQTIGDKRQRGLSCSLLALLDSLVLVAGPAVGGYPPVKNLGWLYWLPNPLLPFIWFRVVVPRHHPELVS